MLTKPKNDMHINSAAPSPINLDGSKPGWKPAPTHREFFPFLCEPFGPIHIGPIHIGPRFSVFFINNTIVSAVLNEFNRKVVIVI